MLHTTDAEMKGGASGVCQLLPICQLFSFCGLPLPTPSQAYTDNAAVHAIVESARMTPRCRHIDIPIALLHQEHNKSFKLDLTQTMDMLADMGTKANTHQTHKQFKYWISGVQYLPQEGNLHYDLLQMQFYEKNYAEVLKTLSKISS